MTWIKLHQCGQERDVNFDAVEEFKAGAMNMGTVVAWRRIAPSGEHYDETPEQIRALIAEAERGAKGEPPKIDARKIEEMCEALQREAQFLGECPIDKPMAMDKQQRRVDDIRAAIRKELGL